MFIAGNKLKGHIHVMFAAEPWRVLVDNSCLIVQRGTFSNEGYVSCFEVTRNLFPGPIGLQDGIRGKFRLVSTFPSSLRRFL